MQVSNALTPVRGDARYIRKLFSSQDMFDNISNYVALGPVSEYEHFEIEYVFQMPISGRSHHGQISVVVLSPTTAAITSHAYEYDESEGEIEILTYTADVSVGSVRLGVTVSGIGENPTFNYRIAAIPAAS
jgi:hypothetical protein